jgi:hypothetical protein
MTENPKPELDWTHLPAGSDAESLWDCLHDGELVSCHSDIINRAVTLEIKVHHLQGKSDDLRFFLHLDNVESVRANGYYRWPGECIVPKGASREEESRIVEEYQAKWREESIGWLSLEGSLSTDPLQIYDAELARSNGKVALRLSGHLDGERFKDLSCSVFLRGIGISASRSDGQPFTLEEFMEMGRRYWEDFSRNAETGPG